jgi:DNA/RNA-binding domain of Phe-tRNA-synthetase-like protein
MKIGNLLVGQLRLHDDDGRFCRRLRLRDARRHRPTRGLN